MLLQQYLDELSKIINPDLIFCYSQQNPDSLVMLYSVEKVLSKLICIKNQTTFLWSIENVTQELSSKIQNLSEQTGALIKLFPNIERLFQFLSHSKQLKDLIIISSPNDTKNILKMDRRNQIKAIIEYPVLEEQYELDLKNEENNPAKTQVIQVCTQKSLFIMVNTLCRQKWNYKELMNFVTLKGEVWKSNVLIRTMMAMINQQVDLPTRGQILTQFQKLIDRIQQKSQFQQLLKELKSGPLPLTRAIYWYTHQVGIYKIMNNLLRSSSHPSQVFYLQPVFKDIFSAIQNLHKKNKKQDFVCYRGGSLYGNQIKELENNVGGIIKNLSFLSTSLHQQIAIQFMKNVLFEISVVNSEDQTNQQFKFDYGYANVKKYSTYSGEDEVIFNPLSSFKILEVMEKQNPNLKVTEFFIKLQYGSLTKTLRKMQKVGEKSLSEAQKCLCTLGKLWREEQEKMNSQGSVLIAKDQNLPNASQYWEKYQEIAKKFQHTCTGFINWGKAEENKGSYKQSLKLYEKAKTEFIKNYGSFSIQEIDNKQQKQFLKMSSKPSVNETKIDLYCQIQIGIANMLNQMGKFQKAKQICDEAYKSQKQVHPKYGEILTLLAKTFQKLGEYQKSQQLYQQICQIRLNQLGEAHPLYVKALFGLAGSNRSLGRFSEAEKLYQKCSNLFLLTIGQTHPDHLNTLNYLALTYKQLSQYMQARQLFEKCCKLAEQTLGKNHPIFLSSLRNFAVSLCAMGDHQQAQRKLQKCLQILANNAEQLEPMFLHCLNSLATIQRAQGNYLEALKLRKRCCSLALSIYGKKHPIYLNYWHNLSLSLRDIKDYKEAEQILNQCCALQLEAADETHPSYIIMLNNLGTLLYRMKKYSLAIENFNKSEKLCLQTYGERTHLYLDIIGSLANAYNHMKDYQNAKILQEKCCQLNSQILGQSHPDYIISLNNLAGIYSQQQKYTAALSVYERSLQLSLQIFGEKHQNYLKTLSFVAMLYWQLGELEKVLEIQKKCCQMLSQGHIRYIDSLYHLIIALFHIGKYEETFAPSKRLLRLINRQKQPKMYYYLLTIFNHIFTKLAQYQKALRFLIIRSRIRAVFLPKIKKQKEQIKLKQKIKFMKKKISQPLNSIDFLNSF